MAAAKGNQNAKGNRGGKSLNDRQLSASVRTLALNEIKTILERPGMDEFKKQLVLKLAPTLLPRLNEHTGEDGDAINHAITGINYIVPNGDNPKADVQTAPSVSGS
jgi:hypothetical protein